MTGNVLLLFTKPAVAGRVKTRLAASGVGVVAAAELHAAFFGDLVERFERLERPERSEPPHCSDPSECAEPPEPPDHCELELVPCWALAPGEAVPLWPGGGLRQAEGDLGARLFRAFRACAERSPAARFAVAIGADCPDLSAELVESAVAALERGADLALAPAADGGFVLIALSPRSVPDRLFEGIEWSGAKVLESTLERAEELGLRTALLAGARDVDTFDDLIALADRLAVADPALCPRTRAALAELGEVLSERLPCAS